MALLQSGPLSPSDVPSDEDVGDDCSSDSTASTGKLKPDDEIDDDDEPSGSSRGPLRLRVKCSGGNLRPPPPSSDASTNTTAGDEYPLSISPSATVADLKASVRQVVLESGAGSREQRYLRLIVRGRLLAPDAAPVSNFGLRDDDVVHAVVAAAGALWPPSRALPSGGLPPRRRRKKN